MERVRSRRFANEVYLDKRNDPTFEPSDWQQYLDGFKPPEDERSSAEKIEAIKAKLLLSALVSGHLR